MIDYENFQKSLKHLELQFQNYQDAATRTDLSDIDREGIAESVIHRFEICFDTLGKHLKRYLNEEMGLPDVPVGPKPLLRLADQNKLLRSPIEQWLKYLEARNNTTHDYSVEKAQDCLALMKDFIDDAIGLYQTLTGTTWE